MKWRKVFLSHRNAGIRSRVYGIFKGHYKWPEFSLKFIYREIEVFLNKQSQNVIPFFSCDAESKHSALNIAKSRNWLSIFLAYGSSSKHFLLKLRVIRNRLLKQIVIIPLHKGVPQAVKKDEQLHEWLAAIDILRAGRAREKNWH